MTLRNYQVSAVEFLLARQRAAIHAPAGSGKTVIAASAVARKVSPGQKVGWLCATNEQKEQAVRALSEQEGPAGVSVTVECAAARPDFRDVDILVIDECHHIPAQGVWLPVVKNVKQSATVWGFSATPFDGKSGLDGKKSRDEVIREIFVEFFAVDRQEILAQGYLAAGRVCFWDVDSEGQFDAGIEKEANKEIISRCRRFPQVARFEHERRVIWQITQQRVQTNEARNAKAIELAQHEASLGHSTLVIVGAIEHGQLLSDATPGSTLVFSKIGMKKRRERIEAFRAGEIKILYGTSIFDEGFDSPNASRLVLVCGGRSSNRIEQRIGRVLRAHPGKEYGLCHDFLDTGARFAFAQARSRASTYASLGYPVVYNH
jgi:superfamily II DNA or RNA helicase